VEVTPSLLPGAFYAWPMFNMATHRVLAKSVGEKL